MGLVIGGERSGVGKTTVTLSLLAAMRRRQWRVQSFKVGPDYIDPMFHRYVTERACRNLDPVLTSESYVQTCFARHTQDVEYALVEGVMGLFDGAAGDRGRETGGFASTAHIARLLDLPVVLVIDCSRVSHSVAAIAHGYRTFDPRIQIAGVVLNRVGSDRHLDLLRDALEPLHLPIVGSFRRHDQITIPDRHLGLVPTDELPEMNVLIARLADLGEQSFDWSQLTPLLEVGVYAPPVCLEASCTPVTLNQHNQQEETRYEFNSLASLRLAVARDRAFNFYYEDNLDLLRALGAELIFWSPLVDEELPSEVQGLYFGGGFPEMFAAALTENKAGRRAVRTAIEQGMPTYAECGGLMYLCQEIIDFEDALWPMVGILPTAAYMKRPLSLGYRRAIALHNSPLLSQGTTVWGHEFHRSGLVPESDIPLLQTQGLQSDSPIQHEGWQRYQVHASYIHLHWGDRPELPTRFLNHCQAFRPYLKTQF